MNKEQLELVRKNFEDMQAKMGDDPLLQSLASFFEILLHLEQRITVLEKKSNG